MSSRSQCRSTRHKRSTSSTVSKISRGQNVQAFKRNQIIIQSLYVMCWGYGSQCKSRRAGVMWSHLCTRNTLTRPCCYPLWLWLWPTQSMSHLKTIKLPTHLLNSNFQLVNIGLKPRDIVLTNIYRPPSSSKSIFLEEFCSLLATLGTDAADRLMICGDFNLPGISPNKIDDDLADLLNSTCFTQHIDASIRHDSHHTRSSLLDLINTPPQKFLTMI